MPVGQKAYQEEKACPVEKAYHLILPQFPQLLKFPEHLSAGLSTPRFPPLHLASISNAVRFAFCLNRSTALFPVSRFCAITTQGVTILRQHSRNACRDCKIFRFWPKVPRFWLETSSNVQRCATSSFRMSVA